MSKVFLGFDPHGLKTSFSYVVKNALLEYCNKENISYTFDLDDDVKVAIVPSGIDFFTYYAAFKKRDIKVKVVAASSLADFMIKKDKNGQSLTLSLDAINYYRKADELLIHLPSQKKFLENFNITTPISIVPFYHNSTSDNMLSSQKDAFMHHYQLQPNREVIVSYGILTKKETVMNLRAIARNIPEKDFIFFRKVTPEAMKQTLFEGITKPDNLFFYPHLPEELYPSFLLNCKRLLLIGDYLASPQILIDCIYHKIPLIAYKMSGYEEILNENTASIAKTYFALYNVLNEPANIAKADAAYETLERLKVFPALNTK
jgi:hypothetical protein